MAPLTAPPDCVRCSRLTAKIAELEDRISNLYKIQEAEQFLDTFILGPVLTDPTAGSVPPPVTEPAAPAIGPAAEATSSPPVTEPAAPTVGPAVAVDSLPAEEPNNSWVRLGARPKLIPVSSTPSRQAPWIWIGDGSRGGRRSSRVPPSRDIKLQNKYDVLHDFPSFLAEELPAHCHNNSSPVSSPAKPQRPTRRSLPQFTPAPQRAPVSCSVHLSPSLPPSRIHISQSKLLLELSQSPEDKKSQNHSSTPSSAPPPAPASTALGSKHLVQPPAPTPLFSPTALIIGDSLVRNVRFFNAITHCIPGATTVHILDQLPSIIASLPPTITKIIVHVGTCDVTL
ncbi:LOW QUALITY PROTEIN: uncharacterized protein LOC116399339 [Xyrichtys novacula]|uniref:LOW QUALITY PROTEIN: uncharacterized protein LOC116399339 n=1 Tax=Xyrichtys novacula TaxID=13765 RepID=A0AAV1GNR5_XYRNO|nr:LOW QUALITY PROTEIN: uncharacterized protein LOC116399339 [Xyrichtys novacula]